MLKDAQDPDILRHYEGLIFKTAQLTAPLVEDDFEDVQQILRIKVWRALIAWDPSRAPKLIARVGHDEARDRCVFAWMKNQTKDIVKKKRRGELSIEDLVSTETPSGGLQTRDSFDQRYLSSSADEVFGAVEDELPLIPSTLTEAELQVVCLLYRDYRQSEVARYLELPKRDVERLVRSIRTKMADWRPATELEIPTAKAETPIAA